MIAYFRRDCAAVLDCADRAIALADEHRLANIGPDARVLRRWALVERGEIEQGLTELRGGLDTLKALNNRVWAGCLRTAPVDSYARAGNIEAGLMAGREVLEYITRGGDDFWHAEALRVRGQLLISAARHDEGEAVLHQALGVAREQGARSLELRAATSLAQLWRNQRRIMEARDLLAPVYGWFTEGFDTPDLKDAKALLEELVEKIT